MRQLGESNPKRFAEAWETTVADLDRYYHLNKEADESAADGHRRRCFKLETVKARYTALCTKCLVQRHGDTPCSGMTGEPSDAAKKWWAKLRRSGTKDATTVATGCGKSRKVIDKWMGFRPS